MGKRGQVYILAAILLAVVVYGLSTVVNVVQQEEIKGDFGALSSNYETESSKLINSVLESGGNLSDSFSRFTFLFTGYSKAKSPNFNLFYALAYKNELHVGNFMDESVFVYNSCPGSVCPPSEMPLEGCLSNVSARLSFEGLTIQAGDLFDVDFDFLRGKCTGIIPVSGAEEYCVNIGGVMYKLPVEENVPRIFSLSRLKTGEQVLYSAQGEIGKEKVCTGISEGSCCKDFCCWDEEDGVCREGKCVASKECDGMIPCKRCYCDAGEYCEESSRLCKSPCDDGTRIGKCSATKPKYCNSDRVLVDECGGCGCPGDQECRPSGGCCVQEGESCDASRPCCKYHYCDGICKMLNENCEDGFDNNGNGKVDCKDSECDDYCSSTNPPKGCKDGVLVADCSKCGSYCPAEKPKCEDNRCKEKTKYMKCTSINTYEGDCNDCVSKCDDECKSGCNRNPDDIWVSTTKKGDCSCTWWWCKEKCKVTCREVKKTGCSTNPVCPSGFNPEGPYDC